MDGRTEMKEEDGGRKEMKKGDEEEKGKKQNVQLNAYHGTRVYGI